MKIKLKNLISFYCKKFLTLFFVLSLFLGFSNTIFASSNYWSFTPTTFTIINVPSDHDLWIYDSNGVAITQKQSTDLGTTEYALVIGTYVLLPTTGVDCAVSYDTCVLNNSDIIVESGSYDISVVEDREALTEDSIKGDNTDFLNVTLPLGVLPLTGVNDSEIVWTSSDSTIVSNDGQTVVRPAFGSEDVLITLTANLTKGEVIETKIFNLKILAETLRDDQTTPDGDGNVVINNTTPNVVIVNPTDNVNVTISSDTIEPKIDVSTFITAGVGTIPVINITAGNAGNVIVSIPATTVTSTDSSWDGIILAPRIVTSSGIPPSGFSIGNTIIEVGSNLSTLSFNDPVKITLPNIRGTVGYKSAGSTDWQIVTTGCNGIDDSSNISSGECYFTNDNDTIIWTYHFTSFGGLNTIVSRSGSAGRNTGPVTFLPIVGEVLGVETKQIEGCDDRTTGFSVTNGISCAGSFTTKTNGKVLGAEKFNFTLRLRTGLNGNEIMELQKLLTNLGYDVGKLDGKFGLKTKAGVIKFQIANNLKGDGIVGALTRTILNK